MTIRVFTHTTSDGLRLSGHIHIPENPRAVMSLVHGFGEHQGRYGPMVQHLNDAGIAVVTMDLRGHGISEGKRGVCKDYALMIDDVGAQIRKGARTLPNLPQYLYGHSMGGGIVLRFASDAGRAAELSGLIVSAPLIKLPKALPKAQITAVKLLRRFAPNMTIPNPIAGDQISTLPDEQARYESDELNHDRLGIGLALDMIENGEIVLSRAENFSRPILLVHAKNDQLTASSASEEFASRAPNCDLHIFENCEHELHNDIARSEVYGLMTRFMDITGVTA